MNLLISGKEFTAGKFLSEYDRVKVSFTFTYLVSIPVNYAVKVFHSALVNIEAEMLIGRTEEPSSEVSFAARFHRRPPQDSEGVSVVRNDRLCRHVRLPPIVATLRLSQLWADKAKTPAWPHRTWSEHSGIVGVEHRNLSSRSYVAYALKQNSNVVIQETRSPVLDHMCYALKQNSKCGDTGDTGNLRF
ncbi:hypothetical protein J6590_002755 [Homalodisca vitripennis]|nr:hypothetical protein J6590_002755 [Homalodisca vitripennis]